jgi:IMP and pyridine-specific 5'-nucleotidase
MSSSRLKEQDEFIQLIRSYICDPHDTPMTVEEAFEAVQSLLDEHYKDGIHRSVRLHRLCPNMGRLFSSLNLVEALQEYDIGVRITKRKFVPPSFKEIRQVINIATVRAVASSIRLLTLDADDTIYNDGCTLKIDSPMVPLITKFMRRGIHVSLVTAASYPGEPHRYEQRLAGKFFIFSDKLLDRITAK